MPTQDHRTDIDDMPNQAAKLMRERCAMEIENLAGLPLVSGVPITAAMVRDWIEAIRTLDVDDNR